MNAVVFGPDGAWLASGGGDGTVRVWDRATDSVSAVLTGHTGTVNALAVSPDGNWLATRGRGHTIRIWDTSGMCLAAIRTDQPVRGLAWGTVLAAVGTRGVSVYDFLPAQRTLNPADTTRHVRARRREMRTRRSMFGWPDRPFAGCYTADAFAICQGNASGAGFARLRADTPADRCVTHDPRREGARTRYDRLHPRACR